MNFDNKRVRVITGTFKGEEGNITKYIPENQSFLISFDNKSKNIDEIHWYKGEIEILP